MMTVEEVHSELSDLLVSINKQIEIVTTTAHSMKISPLEMRHPDGALVMTDLLLAKAHALHALLMLQRESSSIFIQTNFPKPYGN